MLNTEEFIRSAKDKAKTIKIEPSRDALLDEISKTRLQDSYMMDGEVSPQERYAFVSAAFSSNPDHAQRMYDYASQHMFGYSTPILSFGRNKKSMTISCFLPMIPDTAEGLVNTLSEVNWMSMLGGGVGLYFGIRSKDDKSAGMIPHMKTYDASSLAYKQGTTRRGSYAVYVDIDHPEIIEFLEMRKVSGDPNRRCLNLHNAVNITDKFMQIVERCMTDPKADDSWELKDPITKEVKEVVSAKDLWTKILELRAGAGRGEPYIHFIDTSNNAAPEAYKKNHLKILHSNLCMRGDIEISIEDCGNFETLCIKDFVEKYELGLYLNPKVKTSYNGVVFYSPISNAAATGSSTELIRIETENGKVIECTPNHLIFTKNRGWIEAATLDENDELEEIS